MEFGMILLVLSLIIFAILVKAMAEVLEKFEVKRSDKPHLREQL